MGASGGFGGLGRLGGAGAANWFVSISGSDANTGKSPSQAFATLEAAATAVGSTPNQKIALAKGSSWKGQLTIGTAGSPVVGTKVLTYGAGADPFIDASDQILNASFTLAAAQTLTYTAAVTFTSLSGSTDQRSIWENGKCLTQATSIANCEATAGSCFFDSYTAGSANVYVHASDGSNVSTNGKLYEYPKRLQCINLYGDNCRVSGIRTRRQRDPNGSLNILGDYGWIVNCTIEDGNKHSSYNQEGGGYLSCTFKNAYDVAGMANYIVFNKSAGASRGLTVQNCTFLTDGNVVPVNTVTDIISHTTTGNFGALAISGCTHTNSLKLCVPQNITSMNMSGFTALNCSGIGSDTTEAIAATIANSTFTINVGTISAGNALPFNASPPSSRSTVTHSNVTFNTATYEPALCGGNNVDYVWTGSSITAANTSARFPRGLIRLTGTGCTLAVNNCGLNSGEANDAFFNLAADTIYSGDNNAFVKTTSAHFQRAGTDVATTLAGWQAYTTSAAVGHDASSTLV